MENKNHDIILNMEKPPENSKFLGEKYNTLHTSKEVNRAVATSEKDVPQKKESQINAYLERLENVLGKEPEGKGYLTGEERLEAILMKDFVLDINNQDLLVDLSYALYESERKIATERGHGFLEISENELLNTYEDTIIEKYETQKKTLSSWLNYLKQNDAGYPIWFRYFVVRSLKNMGQFSRDEIRYSNRTSDTVAPFPEFNAESLGFVKKSLEKQFEIEENQEIKINNKDSKEVKESKKNLKQEKYQDYIKTVKLDDKRRPELEKELIKRLESKDFAKLYSFAQIEAAGSLNRESLDGTWKKYAQGTDYRLLEDSLNGKNTGWCTATGSANEQLKLGDFYVYYTKGDNGIYTEPRIAIRMEDGVIAEVRGVNKNQELEPELVDTAKEMYKDLPGADMYEKAEHDMKLMTSIYNKCFKIDKETKEKIYTNKLLNKEELIFLYEIKDKIKGFGHESDPRIQELREKRNSVEDACVIFNYSKDQVAVNVSEMSENTKIYIGDLEQGIFEKISSSVTVFTSFPENRIQFLEPNLTTLYPKTVGAWIDAYSKKGRKLDPQEEDGIVISNGSKMIGVMEQTELPKNQKFIELSVKDLGFKSSVSYEDICSKAKTLGLEMCTQDDGPKIGLSCSQLSNDFFAMAMKPISISNGFSYVWMLLSKDKEIILTERKTKLDTMYGISKKIVFRAPN